MSRIFLVGMPGVGKTYWGRILAERSGFAFADLDEYIEQSEGRTVHEIFAINGEAYFRQKETQCLHKLSTNDRVIIACGGGTPVYNDNMIWMKENGCVVYMEADMSTLLDRVGNNMTRPLLDGEDIRSKMEGLFQARLPYYLQAHHSIRVDEGIITNFEEIVALCTNLH